MSDEKIYSQAQVNAGIRSWLAFSASNVVVGQVDNCAKLLLGIRGQPAQSIPEPGQYCLIGGFNTEVPGPAMFRDVADAHMQAQLGLTPESYVVTTDFRVCEYEMANIVDPLKTSLGELPIKRVAFDRTVRLRQRSIPNIKPQGKLSGVQWFTSAEFEALVATGQVSFPHQVASVQKTLREVELIYEIAASYLE